MSALPWNEYAIRCELKLTLENDSRYMVDKKFLIWHTLGIALRRKYGVTQRAYDAAWLSVCAALHPSEPQFKGVTPHHDSCIPSERAYYAAVKRDFEQAAEIEDIRFKLFDEALAEGVPTTTELWSKYSGTTTGRMSSSQPSMQQIPKEKKMSAPIEIKTVTYVNGTAIDQMPDATIYALIASEEAKIEELGKIKAKPKKLEAEIAKRTAGIAALVAHLDNK